uniref:Uncharacterized protein n=1 Tax=Physcomitrium patens TaxID=3218 RepID=A9RC36_PHYPA|nr:hypothetical protein PHYPA_010563 [Physcomitrium patens]
MPAMGMQGDLEINVQNEKSGTGRRSCLMGRVVVPTNTVLSKPEAVRWYQLQKRGLFSQVKGDLRVNYTFPWGIRARQDDEAGEELRHLHGIPHHARRVSRRTDDEGTSGRRMEDEGAAAAAARECRKNKQIEGTL